MSFLSTIEKYGAAMYFLAFTQRGCLHETRHEIYRDEISTHHKRSFVYITFHCGWNEVKFRFRGGERARGGEWSEKNGPSSKSQLFLFWWTKRMCSCSLSYDFISGSLYMIFYPPKWNFIFVKMAAMKHHQQ